MLTTELVGQAKGQKEAEAVPAAVFVPLLEYRIQVLHRGVVQEIVSDWNLVWGGFNTDSHKVWTIVTQEF